MNDGAKRPSSDETSKERLLPYNDLRGLVNRILKNKITSSSDIDDISQEVFRRGWEWASKNDTPLTEDEWKNLISKITFNEINRFYSKQSRRIKTDAILEDVSLMVSDPSVLDPQLIMEVVENLRKLSLRQRLSLALRGGEMLSYIMAIYTPRYIANLLEIDYELLVLIEPEIPLSDERIKDIIEQATEKKCRSSIRDERAKGRKRIKKRLFGS